MTLTTRAGNGASPALKGDWFPDGFHGTMGELLCAIEEDREPINSARENLQQPRPLLRGHRQRVGRHGKNAG